MSTIDLAGLLDRLPPKATLDQVTGQVRYGNGVRICYHAGRTETVRDTVHRERRKTRDGRRWALRWARRPVRVSRLSCPDCPAWVEHIVPAGLRVDASLAPYVFPRESA